MREAEGSDLTKSTIKRTLTTTIMIGALSLAGLLTTQQVSAASTIHVAQTGVDSSTCGGAVDPCQTIQQAVDNATSGDTISVATGTYDGNITIDKALTIRGVQAGMDARTRSGAETIVQQPAGTQSAFVITHDDVTIDGFTIDGTNGTGSVGVYLPSATAYPGASTKNATITNTIITHNKVGIDALASDASGLRVSQNLFVANTQTGQSDGVYLASGSGSDIEIANNAFHDNYAGTSGAAAVAISISSSTPSYSNVRILGNTSDNDYGLVSADSVSNLTIKDNTASNETKAAVTLDRDTNGVTIADNTFKDSVAGVSLRGNPTLGGGGAAISGVTISGNTISGMSGAAILIASGAIADAPTVNNNSITGNALGIDNASAVAVTADNNWWGCAAGPGTPGCDSVNGPVTASVWYTNAAMTTTNATNPTDPSAPAGSGDLLANTGENALAIFDITLLVIALVVGGFVAVRRRITKN